MHKANLIICKIKNSSNFAICMFIIAGMGPNLYVFRHCKLEQKLDCLYPSNIHGIVVGANNKLAVFGAKSICIYNIDEIAYDIKYVIIFKYNRNIII